ncbi:hypothetical protein [Streptomyces roseoviridis]|uniref:LPXTG cell wall anchor domain-containing protein n=1 Tax=Streptomyces roseoviridis TaxID=67361 RepID=A0ABV5QU58_9ACTN
MYGSAGKGAVGAGVVIGGGQLAVTGGTPGVVTTLLAVALVLGGVLMVRSARIKAAKG